MTGVLRKRGNLDTETDKHRGKMTLRDIESRSSTSQCGKCGLDLWVRKTPWRRKWQPTPVLLPGKSHGQRSLEGCSPWSHKESGMTEATEHALGEFLIMIPEILRSHTSICNLISCIIFM